MPPLRLVDVVDEVGAGDAFAAGSPTAWPGWAPPDCAHCGNVIARRLAGTGDWETLPRLAKFRPTWPRSVH